MSAAEIDIDRARRSLWRNNASHLCWAMVVDVDNCDFTHCSILFEDTMIRTYVPVLQRAWPGPSSMNGSHEAMIAWWAARYFLGEPVPELPRFTIGGRRFEMLVGCAPRVETRPFVERQEWGGSIRRGEPRLVSAWRRREFGPPGDW